MVTYGSLSALRAVADPTRREIVERLSSGGLAVGEIAAGLPMSRPAVSKHLRVLRELGLVLETKVGRRRIYELVAAPLEEMADWLERQAAGAGARHDRVAATEVTQAPATRSGRERGIPVESPRGPSTEESTGESGDRWRSW